MPLAGCIFDQLCLTMLKSAHKIWLCTELPHLLWKNKKHKNASEALFAPSFNYGPQMTSAHLKSHEVWKLQVWVGRVMRGEMTSADWKSCEVRKRQVLIRKVTTICV